MIMLFVLGLFGAGMCLAGQGNGPGNGTGPIHDIFSGVLFTFDGEVVSCAQGGGMTLDTTDGEVLLYGIGPDYYWEKLGVDHPAIGDILTATGYTVDYNGIDRNVVTSITIDGITVDLRDPETGKPLWRGTKGCAGSGCSTGFGNSGSSGGNAGSGGPASSGGSKGGACK